MEMRIAVPNATSAESLVRQLGAVFDAASVSLDEGRKEVRVRGGREPNRALVKLLQVVDAWLEREAVVSAPVWFGDRSYTLVGSGREKATL